MRAVVILVTLAVAGRAPPVSPSRHDAILLPRIHLDPLAETLARLQDLGMRRGVRRKAAAYTSLARRSPSQRRGDCKTDNIRSSTEVRSGRKPTVFLAGALTRVALLSLPTMGTTLGMMPILEPLNALPK